jgi:hypothetical protein
MSIITFFLKCYFSYFTNPHNISTRNKYNLHLTKNIGITPYLLWSRLFLTHKTVTPILYQKKEKESSYQLNFTIKTN